MDFTPEAVEQLQGAWRRHARHALFRGPGEFQDLVRQCLSRDIRSVHQRTLADASRPSDTGRYHLVVEGIDVSYDVLEPRPGTKEVVVRGASKADAAADHQENDGEGPEVPASAPAEAAPDPGPSPVSAPVVARLIDHFEGVSSPQGKKAPARSAGKAT